MNNLQVTQKTKLVDANGAELKLIKNQLMAMSDKNTNAKDILIKGAFKGFLEEDDIDVSNFKFSSFQVLIRLFMYKEVRGVMDSEGRPIVNTTIFPVAKVVTAGPDSIYKAGQVVKLKDFEACEVTNPNYELWVKNGMDKGSLSKIGDAPPATLNNFINLHGKKVFNPDPIKSNIVFDDMDLFVLFDPNIECTVIDPLKLLK